MGTALCGSEQDYIIKDGIAAYKFGKGYYEADVGDKYTFKYTYGNGDSYQGTVYRTPGAVYYPGWKSSPKANETGKLGYYQILSMAYTGATAKYNQVFVDTYHDGESNKDFTPVHKGQAVGTALCGSEQDYIVKDGVAAYKFGKGYTEADVGDKYTFKYTYGNGDYYEGYVYRTPGYVYYPGYKVTKKNELGLTSYYQILSMGYTGETTNYGKVYVTKYYDGDQTKKSYNPLNYLSSLGVNFLGSEAGYILSQHAVRSFGKGREADAFYSYIGNFHGIDYGPFRHPGESPETGNFPTEAEIKTDLGIIAQKFTYVRTYALDNSLKKIVPLANTYYPKLKFVIGVYETGGDLHTTMTEPQLDEAIRLANSYKNVIGVAVGNECLPGDATSSPVTLATLIEDLKYVRAGIKRAEVSVTTNLSYGAAMAKGAELEPYCDLMMINIYPFYAPVTIGEAVVNLRQSYNQFHNKFDPKAKQVIVGETGWPSAGPDNGAAVPSIANQKKFVTDVEKQAADLTLFYFEMFDEPWKHENAWATHWGLYDQNGRPKFDWP